ncbi:fimbrial protein [Lelliottia sp. SL45]|jgi:minor fimbrial subunit|uniref:fimbrial protein n=1 Tax=Lelliottia TaxID=1330545 RepID=UPI000FA27341|nr:fimbrial protein [Lelliottia sp. SL45]MCY1697938.1 fimbrial protein [Lelliottia sp. SL45]
MVKTIVTAFFVVLLISASNAFADEGTALNISANIVASPCTLSEDTVHGKVPLGSFYTNELSNRGDATGWVPFALKLTECPVTTTAVSVVFTGDADESNPDFFKNMGSSSHVAIEIKDTGGSIVRNGATRTITVNPSHDAVLDLQSRMVTPQGSATAGSVTGLVELSFSYQ